jgi:hypothetical protein
VIERVVADGMALAGGSRDQVRVPGRGDADHEEGGVGSMLAPAMGSLPRVGWGVADAPGRHAYATAPKSGGMIAPWRGS